jgi:hypothetical protein
VYTVACEPAISNYMYARDFMVSVADITQGQAVALGSAQLLVDVILGKYLCDCCDHYLVLDASCLFVDIDVFSKVRSMMNSV